jgi:hypothetical protein
MGTRLELQTVLEGLQSGVSVYFQPPSNVTMFYPAIVYNRDYQAAQFADNRPYSRKIRYQITVIDPDPDSLIPDKVAELPMARYVRHYTTENLNHDIYDVYF